VFALLGADGRTVVEGWSDSVEDCFGVLATQLGRFDLKLKLDLKVAQFEIAHMLEQFFEQNRR
jgi:hypothetical protein